MLKLLASHLKTAEYARMVHCVTLDESVDLDSFLLPETYVHVMRQLKQGDHIEVTADDGSWWAELLVRACDGMDIQVALLRKVEFEALEDKGVDLYAVEWKGPNAKWRVTRKSDKQIMVEGLPSKLAGLQWIERPTQQAA